MQKIGLFFGSFNPVHHGHLILAQHLAEEGDLDEVWMVLSPHNPHKERKSLAPDHDRLELLELALAGHKKLRTCDIEFYLPKPSYTIDTLVHLGEKHPDTEFVLLIGGDNVETLPRWKNHEFLLSRYQIYVYPRPGYQVPQEILARGRFRVIDDTPQMNISSTRLRALQKEGKSLRYWVPDVVAEEIEKLGLYS